MLNNELTQGLVTGKPYNQIIEEMSKKLDVKKWKIERLVRTEGAFVTNQAQLSAYYKSGIKQYRYLARLDERTSEACRELNGKVFDVDKAQAGENYPPMHPYCRSVTEAVFDKDKEENNEIDKEVLDEYFNSDLEGKKKICDNLFKGNYPKNIKITEIGKHAIEQAEKRGVLLNDIKFTLNNPKKISDIKVDKNSVKSYIVESEKCAVVINPDTGKIITVWNK